MSSTTITITRLNSTNYAQWATEMALLLEQKHVDGIIKGYNDKPESQQQTRHLPRRQLSKIG
jgi:hypothetical protein